MVPGMGIPKTSRLILAFMFISLNLKTYPERLLFYLVTLL
jgi:hypothetical protein